MLLITKGQWGVGYLAGTGSSLFVLISWWFSMRDRPGLMGFVGTVTGLLLSLALVYLAYWLTRSELRDEHVWAVSRLGAIGLLIPTVPVVGIAVSGVAETARVEPSTLVGISAASAVIGALFGAVTELEDEHGRVLAANRRNVVLNRVLRHDLRNDAAVLLMLADELEAEFGTAADAYARPLREKTGELVDLSDAAKRVDGLGRDASDGPIDIAAVVRDTVSTVRSTHPSVDIETEVPDAAWVRADDVLRSVVDNLVENAIEHNDGTPHVRISIRKPAHPDGDVEVLVADDGPGMPEATARVLSRSDVSDTVDPPPETGLGLWLVRWFVEACDGELTIEDNVPRGTVVRVALPSFASGRESPGTVETPA